MDQVPRIDPSLQPSVFELIAQRRLVPGLKRIFSYIVQNWAQRRPGGSSLQKYHDEIFYAFVYLVDRHYLQHYDATFAENTYDLKRVSLTQSSVKPANRSVLETLKEKPEGKDGELTDEASSLILNTKKQDSILNNSLSSSDRSRALFASVILPYLRSKAEQRFDELSEIAEDLRDAGSTDERPQQRFTLPPFPVRDELNHIRLPNSLQSNQRMPSSSPLELILNALTEIMNIDVWCNERKYALKCLKYAISGSMQLIQHSIDWCILNHYPTVHTSIELINLILHLNALSGVGLFFSIDQAFITRQSLRRMGMYDLMLMSQPDFPGYSTLRRREHMSDAKQNANYDKNSLFAKLETIWIKNSLSRFNIVAKIVRLLTNLKRLLVRLQRMISMGLNKLTGSLKWLIFAALISVQVYEWWLVLNARGQVSGQNLQSALTRTTPIPPPPPPFANPGDVSQVDSGEAGTMKVSLPQDPTICALCKKSWVNPAATPMGYVYCYSCLFNFVTAYGSCPVTGIPCQVSHIRKVYPE